MSRLLRLAFLGIVLAALMAPVPTQADHTAYQLGDVFVSVGDGEVEWYHPDGTYNRTLQGAFSAYTTGSGFDKFKNFYATGFTNNAISKFDENGVFLGVFATGDPQGGAPESVNVTRSATETGTNFHVYAGQASGSKDILKFDEAGALVDRFDVEIERLGSDWIDLATDLCTMYYTSEGTRVLRYDVCSRTQLPDFTKGLFEGFALRIRPGGEVIVADQVDIRRFNADGSLAQVYDAPLQECWFGLSMNPDNTSFWSSDYCNSQVVKFDIDSGAVLQTITPKKLGRVFGVSVFGEKTASGAGEYPVCGAAVTQGGWGYTTTGTRATFGGKASVDRDGFAQGQEEYQDHGLGLNFHSITVDRVTCSQTHANISGMGMVNGNLPVRFDINVDDLGEPGAGKDRYHLKLAGGVLYDSGEILLQGGNVQIHRA